MKKSMVILFGILVMILVGSCMTKPMQGQKKGGSMLSEYLHIEKPWLLVGYRKEGRFIHLEPEHGSFAAIRFGRDRSVSCTSGINHGVGSWQGGQQLENNVFTFSLSPLGVTRMAAPNPIAAKFEHDFFALLQQAVAIRMSTDAFELLDTDQTVLMRFLHRAIPHQ